MYKGVALREMLGKAAEEAGVNYVTINSHPPYISNYDYISQAILEDLGANNTDALHYGADELNSDYEADFEGEGPDKTHVVFPPNPGDYSDFQGRNGEQLIFWKSSTV